MDKSGLMAEVTRAREDLMASLSRVPPGRMGEVALHDAWTTKDLVAHLAFWERRAAALATALLAGETPGPDEALDTINAKAFQASRDLSLETVLVEEGEAYQALMALVSAIPADTLFDTARFPLLGGGSLAEVVINNTSGHYEQHSPELASWIEKQDLRR